MKIKVKKGDSGSYSTNAKFLSVAGLGIVSVATGLFLRRRRERVAERDSECNDVGDHATDFELVQDHAVV
jgi:LPXTG-motif cell wall-anchored protein